MREYFRIGDESLFQLKHFIGMSFCHGDLRQVEQGPQLFEVFPLLIALRRLANQFLLERVNQIGAFKLTDGLLRSQLVNFPSDGTIQHRIDPVA